MTGKNKIKKLISGLLIILIIFPTILLSYPKQGYAIWGMGDVGFNPVGDAAGVTGAAAGTANAVSNASMLGLKIKDVALEVGRQLLKAAAKRVLAEMTKATINWINSDFHGSPLFLENSDSFFQDIAKSELKNIVNTFGYDSLTYPFGKDFALNAIDSYKRQLEDNAGYTMSKVMNMNSVQLKLYRNDFNYGGWNGFLVNTQYPQNNAVGFNMIATQELARRIQGTSQNAAEKIQTQLQQGMGFLSPQTCPSNENYNNGTNEFQRPSFQPPENRCDHTAAFSGDSADMKAYDDCNTAWEASKAEAEADWKEQNACPGGLVNTTPGSVAGNQVMKALGTSFDQTMLDGAMGNSLSAIFDALINHFMSKGLNALSSKINPEPVEDDWSYEGQTLGSSAAEGTNSTWNMSLDQPIILSDFKKKIDDGIKITTAEIKLMYNDAPDELGIYQMFSKIWPKAQELDKCIPGPDTLRLKERIDEEISQINSNIQEKTSGDFFGGGDTDKGDSIIKELTFAVKLFKSWIDDKIIYELPSSLIYIDSVNNITTFSKGMKELVDNRMTKNRALVRLKAIKTTLDTITTQPNPGSAEDRVLVSLWKQYQVASVDFSNTNTLENTRNKLSEAKDVYDDLIKSMDPTNPLGCPAERTAKGWSNPGGPNSTYKNGQTEIEGFCTSPIAGGYSHKEFVNTKGVTHPDIPLVNAKDVLTYKTVTMMSLFFASNGIGFDTEDGSVGLPDPRVERTVSIELNCNNIFNASSLDYKGDLPMVFNTNNESSSTATLTQTNTTPQTETPTTNTSTDSSTDANPNSNTDLTPDPSTNAN